MAEHLIGHETDFSVGERQVLSVDGQEFGFFRLKDGFFVWRNICPHQGGPVCQGRIFRRVVDRVDGEGCLRGRDYHPNDMNIVCPWHGAEFDIRTGYHAGTAKLRLTPVSFAIRNGEVYVDV